MIPGPAFITGWLLAPVILPSRVGRLLSSLFGGLPFAGLWPCAWRCAGLVGFFACFVALFLAVAQGVEVLFQLPLLLVGQGLGRPRRRHVVHGRVFIGHLRRRRGIGRQAAQALRQGSTSGPAEQPDSQAARQQAAKIDRKKVARMLPPRSAPNRKSV